jgi:hypothetical protein
MPFARFQPAQVRLKAERDAFEQQPGRRTVRFRHGGALRLPQPAQQLAALRVHDGEAGFGQLTSAIQCATRSWPAGVSE